MRKALAPVAAVIVLAALLAGSPATVHADPPGYDGICTGDDALDGVTVVVDFQELDGNDDLDAPTIVRCSPNPNPGTDRTGVEALQDAGIDIAGTAQWGLGFICRIDGRPTATEPLPISTPPYTEQCVVTPPAAAHWTYWHADGSDTEWDYASSGAANRTVIPGGFEGWSFSLNNGPTTNPPPGEDPLNPAVGPDNPTVEISADNETIVLPDSALLSWDSTNADEITAHSVNPGTGGGSWSGSLATPDGSQQVTPTSPGTYTYTIRASGEDGTVFATTELTVLP